MGPPEMKILEEKPWFIERMSSDQWNFGLILSDGSRLEITSIIGLQKLGEALWIDVELAEKPIREGWEGSPTSRTTASINAAHIVAAFELHDS